MVSYLNRKCDAYGVRTLLCDTEADVERLPLDGMPGSRAFVVDSGSLYVFDTYRKWKKVADAGEGSGSGSGSGGSGSGGGSQDQYDEIIYDGGDIDKII